MNRFFPLLSWICAWSSFVLLGLYLLLGLHVRLGLGHWPEPMFENYDTPLFRMHNGCLLFILFGVGPLWLFCLLVRAFRPRPPRIIAKQFAFFAAGCLAIAAVLAFDPTPFSAWFLD